MALKIKKLEIDLVIDLTAYIPGADGLLDSTKKTPEQLFAWTKMIAREADQLGSLAKEQNSNEAIIGLTQESMIKQIDWFYEKGESFWKAVPFPVLRDVLEYLRGEVIPAQKK